jgi:hypothetical protein
MGLLIGGSVISIFEILDVFVYNAVEKAGQEKRKSKKPINYLGTPEVVDYETETSESEQSSTAATEGWSTVSG